MQGQIFIMLDFNRFVPKQLFCEMLDVKLSVVTNWINRDKIIKRANIPGIPCEFLDLNTFELGPKMHGKYGDKFENVKDKVGEEIVQVWRLKGLDQYFIDNYGKNKVVCQEIIN